MSTLFLQEELVQVVSQELIQSFILSFVNDFLSFIVLRTDIY